MTNILLIDNFDSFTYNLVEEFVKKGCKVMVYRNNFPMEKLYEVIKKSNIRLIVISPGPGTPKQAGNSIRIVKEFKGVIPIFGVCLGHQAIVEAFGGKVDSAGEIIHGKPSKITHDGKKIYMGLEQNLKVGRYHSLAGKKIPDELEITAKSKEGVIMGVRHKKYFVEGVQFHPESIMTPSGEKMIENLINLVG